PVCSLSSSSSSLFGSSSAYWRLPSFPTRRSSDLGQIPVRAPPVRGRWQPRRRSTVGNPHAHTGHPRSHVVLPVRRDRRSAAREPDRKSTRLNSSHVSISYAVFCLKKKIDDTVSSF